MFFSIRKKYKIQPFFYGGKLGTGKVLSEFSADFEGQTRGGVDLVTLQKQQKIKGTLHDIYHVPKFEDISDLYVFFKDLEGKDTNLEYSEYKAGIIRDICLAYRHAIQYLEQENYYVPKLGKNPQSPGDIIQIMHRGEKMQKAQDKIGYCTILKEVLGFFRIIRCKEFTIDYKTGKIDLRNKEFIKEVMDIFSSKEFIYSNESKQFSEDSNTMDGDLLLENKKFPIYAGFDVKTVYSMIEKMDGQEKYNLPEAFKDIHRMRIELRAPCEALRTAKLLFNKFGKSLKIENVGNMVSENDLKEYIQQFCSGEEDKNFREELEKNLSNEKEAVFDAKKAYSSDRQELKLSRNSKPPIEIQIVLVNNNNETGWAHHDIYKIRRKIVAKIRRHGWIGINGINTIIDAVIEKNTAHNNGKSTIIYSKEQIYKHILSEGFLMPIRGASEGDMNKKIKINHFSTKEVLEKYKHNYSSSSQLGNISVHLGSQGVSGFIPLSGISFPSNS
ncbi:hypothetical protein KBB25_00115 [Candidatus Gracilibacteria bacterium]|nr:hypothetical protein [Candidatus Gracilibacteria bacterium]